MHSKPEQLQESSVQGTTATDKMTAKGLLPQILSPNKNPLHTVRSSWWAWTVAWLIPFTNTAPKSRGRLTSWESVLPLLWQTVPVRKTFGHSSHHATGSPGRGATSHPAIPHPLPSVQETNQRLQRPRSWPIGTKMQDASAVSLAQNFEPVYKTRIVSKRSSQW